MYDELYEFLLQQKELNLPGIGVFSIQRNPAVANFIDKQIQPPAYEITFNEQAQDFSSKRIFFWLAEKLNISDGEAVVRFNDFVFGLKKKIAEGTAIDWKGVGTISKGTNKLFFTPVSLLSIEGPVEAQKMIREHAEHTVLVGERERTSAEMTEFLNDPGEKKNYWWAYALVTGIAAIVFICWFFSDNGITTSSTGNIESISINKEEPTYTLLP